MKFTSEIKIAKPRTEVIEKYSNPDNIKHWQRGFISMNPISGILGEEGSKNKLKYKIGKRKIEMEETIITNDLPEQFHANYTAKGVYNIQENFFEETPGNQTLWISRNEFKFSGLMKLMGIFIPGAFRKQSYQYMKDFKDFVENNESVLREK
ncbi:SRPBCC family protein [Salegentibacter sp. JZCK2]|uniref:SRPBCC family protein n=1 Tax=Salegentibacter tibetensis TaxID=2873600 RepID=UPI001CCD5D7F|nr:SRPBCC family protein [Salegentibacter tibetensis]MBZ9731194.1 SRPBCC family protein [Salegentibacter tibetensis]